MNKCTFLGTVSEFYSISNHDGNIGISVTLQIVNKRESRVKKFDTENLTFEAWGSAAVYLLSNLKVDHQLLVLDATARTVENVVVFRINDFRII